VINVAFASLIAWGASTLWQLGFTISCIYTLALYFLASKLDSLNDNHREEVDDTRDVSETSEDAHYQRTILTSLLYGLSVISLGATGLFLPINIFNCPGERPWPPNPPGRWETDISSLPKGVQSWAESDAEFGHKASFVYLPGTKSTLFSGTNDDTNRNVLWVAPASVYPFHSAEPVEFSNVSMPYEFVSVSESKACFGCAFESQTQIEDFDYRGTPFVPTQKEFTVACSGGKFIRLSRGNTEGISHQSPHDLIASNNTLWYKDYPPSGLQGTVIFSLDPSTMDETIHSRYHGDQEAFHEVESRDIKSLDDQRDCNNTVERKRSIMALFTSALPMTVASMLLWTKKNVSTMGLTTHISISAVAICIYVCIDPLYEKLPTFLKFWHSVFGLVWLAILTDLYFSKRPGLVLTPLQWGLNFGAMAFTMGMIALTGVFEEDTLWRWILLNMLGFVPLGILGLATGQIFLLFLCALGFLADSFRLASWFVEDVDPNSEMPIYFLVLAFAGLCISGFGWFLSRHQAVVHARLSEWFEKLSLSQQGRFRPWSQVRGVDSEYDALPSESSLSDVRDVILSPQDVASTEDDVEA